MRYSAAPLSLVTLFYTVLATPVATPPSPDADTVSIRGAQPDNMAFTGTLFLCQNLNCAGPCNSFNLATEIHNVCIGNSFPFKSALLSIPAGQTGVPTVAVGPLGCAGETGLSNNICRNVQGQSFSIF
ncbi:hypothetical protein C8Q77DRAFT_1161297 [Trametes polyzona]|nr:hypothetical protein C8Q77DRAFT_1161297 [Trametes polyzona]